MRRLVWVLLLALVSLTAGQYQNCPLDPPPACVPPECLRGPDMAAPGALAPETPFRVGFIGDTGISATSLSVLELLRDEGVGLIVHGGDLGYKEGSPADMLAQIRSVFPDPAAVPYLAVLGNHDDNRDWQLGASRNFSHALAAPSRRCYGYSGIGFACTISGLTLAFTVPEYEGPLADEFVLWAFARFPSQWRVCVFHVNQMAMQTASDHPDEAGWSVYEACRRQGAIVATAHDHSYARSFAMSSFRSGATVSTARNESIELTGGPNGTSLVWVTGTGGEPLRSSPSPYALSPWWATALAASDSPPLRHGALVCTFSRALAECEFKQAADRVVRDRFTLVSRVEPARVYERPRVQAPHVQIGTPEAAVNRAPDKTEFKCVKTSADLAAPGASSLFQFTNVPLTYSGVAYAALVFVPRYMSFEPAAFRVAVHAGARVPMQCAAVAPLTGWTSGLTVVSSMWDELMRPERVDITDELNAALFSGLSYLDRTVTVRVDGVRGSRTAYFYSANPCYAPVLEVVPLPSPPPPPPEVVEPPSPPPPPIAVAVPPRVSAGSPSSRAMLTTLAVFGVALLFAVPMFGYWVVRTSGRGGPAVDRRICEIDEASARERAQLAREREDAMRSRQAAADAANAETAAAALALRTRLAWFTRRGGSSDARSTAPLRSSRPSPDDESATRPLVDSAPTSASAPAASASAASVPASAAATAAPPAFAAGRGAGVQPVADRAAAVRARLASGPRIPLPLR